jgi:uncharacterized protein with NRDE domain
MCLILIAIGQHPRFPLVVVANRDEYFNRPAAPARFWPEAPQLLAGRDLQAGGTWLGLTRAGRFAAVTNVREPGRNRPDARSRGDLPTHFLLGDQPATHYLQDLQPHADRYNGFNLICGDIHRLYYYSNRGGDPMALQAGLHGISNHLLDTPWPKVTGGKAALADVLTHEDFSLDALLPVLNQREPAPDEQLPDTGVGLLMERVLSSRFIQAPFAGYGTRVSTALRVDHDGHAQWREWTWDETGNCVQVAEHDFSLAPA